jgi:hypothetical protein
MAFEPHRRVALCARCILPIHIFLYMNKKKTPLIAQKTLSRHCTELASTGVDEAAGFVSFWLNEEQFTNCPWLF